MENTIITALESSDLTGFTTLLTGDKVHRYVIGLTNNHTRSIELLTEQYKRLSEIYKNITIGGRTSPNGDVIVDIGTSTNSLYTAIRLGIKYNQNAIRDSVENREV